jgi:hypothetical protein
MDAWLQDHGSGWRQATESMDEFKQKADELDGKTVSMKFRIETEMDETTKEAMAKGILPEAPSTTEEELSLEPDTTEAEAATTLSAKKIRFATNGGSYQKGVTLNIDARGAEIGVEQRILLALSEIEDRAVARSLSIVQDMVGR